MESERIHLALAAVAALGGLLIAIGVRLLVRMYGRRSVAVDAECIDVSSKTVHVGAFPSTKYRNTKAPVYRYRYQGKEYISQPVLRSNRPGYRPKTGPCRIRIDRRHPEKVFSSERKAVVGLLIGMGSLYIVAMVVAVRVLPL